jgi:hypothetical protein
MGPLSPRFGVTQYCGWKKGLKILITAMKTLQKYLPGMVRKIKYIMN